MCNRILVFKCWSHPWRLLLYWSVWTATEHWQHTTVQASNLAIVLNPLRQPLVQEKKEKKIWKGKRNLRDFSRLVIRSIGFSKYTVRFSVPAASTSRECPYKLMETQNGSRCHLSGSGTGVAPQGQRSRGPGGSAGCSSKGQDGSCLRFWLWETSPETPPPAEVLWERLPLLLSRAVLPPQHAPESSHEDLDARHALTLPEFLRFKLKETICGLDIWYFLIFWTEHRVWHQGASIMFYLWND